MVVAQEVAVARLTRSTPKRYRTFDGRTLRARGHGRGADFVERHHQLQHFKARREAIKADQERLWADRYEPWHECLCMWCSNPNEIEITEDMQTAAEREREMYDR